MVPRGMLNTPSAPPKCFCRSEEEEAAESGGRVHPPLGQCPRPYGTHRQGHSGHQGVDRDDGPTPKRLEKYIFHLFFFLVIFPPFCYVNFSPINFRCHISTNCPIKIYTPISQFVHQITSIIALYFETKP